MKLFFIQFCVFSPPLLYLTPTVSCQLLLLLLQLCSLLANVSFFPGMLKPGIYTSCLPSCSNSPFSLQSCLKFHPAIALIRKWWISFLKVCAEGEGARQGAQPQRPVSPLLPWEVKHFLPLFFFFSNSRNYDLCRKWRLTTIHRYSLSHRLFTPTRRGPPRGIPRVPAPLPLSPFSPPDRDRRGDSPAWCGGMDFPLPFE